MANRYSRVIALLACCGAVGAAALSAQAAPPTPGTAETSQSWNGCVLTANYSWTGFKGRKALAAIRVYRDGEGSTLSLREVDPSGGSASEEYILGSSASAHLIQVEGTLLKPKTQRVIPGSFDLVGELRNCF